MKIVLLVLGLISISMPVTAQSTDTDSNNPETTYFEELGLMFEAGTRPDIERLTSDPYWAGRCFLKRTPNLPKAGIAVFQNQAVDVGPIGRDQYKATFRYRPTGKANYYDVTNPDILIVEILNYNSNSYSEIEIAEDSLVAAIGATSHYVRLTSEGYLIVDVRSNSNQESFARCYYFIPEYN